MWPEFGSGLRSRLEQQGATLSPSFVPSKGSGPPPDFYLPEAQPTSDAGAKDASGSTPATSRTAGTSSDAIRSFVR